jgi:pyruvate kinase
MDKGLQLPGASNARTMPIKPASKCSRPASGAHHLADEPVEYMIGQFGPSNRLGASTRQSNKIIEKVQQITFSGSVVAAESKSVIYVTERCVFRLVSTGLELIELALGIDIERRQSEF